MKFSELKDELRHLEYEAYIWKREAERWKEIAENVHMESIQVKQFNEELICRAQEPWKRVTLDDRSL